MLRFQLLDTVSSAGLRLTVALFVCTYIHTYVHTYIQYIQYISVSGVCGDLIRIFVPVYSLDTILLVFNGFSFQVVLSNHLLLRRVAMVSKFEENFWVCEP